MRFSLTQIALCAIFCLLLVTIPAASALDDTAKDSPPAEDILRGPRVTDQREDQARGFGGERGPVETMRRQRAQPSIPYRLWLRTYNALDLTDEQRSMAEEHVATFQRQVRRHRTATEDERRPLELRARELLMEVGRIRTGEITVDEERAREIREELDAISSRLRELNRNAPTPENLQSELWELLDSDQQETFRSQLDVIRTSLARQQQGGRGQGADEQAAMDDQMQQHEQPDIAPIARANNTFAIELYRKLAEKESGNIFISPLSISAALAMTQSGARGRTAEEMAAVLQLPAGESADESARANLHAAIGSLLRSVSGEHEDEEGGGWRVELANALWGQKDYHFQEDFLAFQNEHYDSPLHQLDFADATAAAKRINTWVEERTNGLIKDLLSEDDLAGVVLVLTNAIYFKGDWLEPFDPDRTRDAPFHLPDGSTVTVPMMNRTDSVKLMTERHVSVLELPYAGKRLSMLVALPGDGHSLSDVECDLSTERIGQWLDNTHSRHAMVFLPRFTVETRYSLKNALVAMGMESAFSDADFSRIDGSGAMFLSDVIHQAFVEVNEEGTEAAAATAAPMVTSIPPTFRADRPFLFMIYDRENNTILFMGRVTDPS